MKNPWLKLRNLKKTFPVGTRVILHNLRSGWERGLYGHLVGRIAIVVGYEIGYAMLILVEFQPDGLELGLSGEQFL